MFKILAGRALNKFSRFWFASAILARSSSPPASSPPASCSGLSRSGVGEGKGVRGGGVASEQHGPLGGENREN